MMPEQLSAGLRALWYVGKATPSRIATLAANSPENLIALRSWVEAGQNFQDADGSGADDTVLALVSEAVSVALDRREDRRPYLGISTDLYVTIPLIPGGRWHVPYSRRPLPSVKSEIEWEASPDHWLPLRIKVDRLILKDRSTRAILYGHVVTPRTARAAERALAGNGFIEHP